MGSGWKSPQGRGKSGFCSLGEDLSLSPGQQCILRQFLLDPLEVVPNLPSATPRSSASHSTEEKESLVSKLLPPQLQTSWKRSLPIFPTSSLLKVCGLKPVTVFIQGLVRWKMNQSLQQ